MNKLLAHAQSNAVAYLALFVALGGTSYAATNLPAGSVGTNQIRDHSVTPAKLATAARRGTLGPTAEVRYWARVSARGRLLAGSPGARSDETGPGLYLMRWGRQHVPRDCMPFASVSGKLGWTAVARENGSPNQVVVVTFVGVGVGDQPGTYTRSAASVDVIVVCPP